MRKNDYRIRIAHAGTIQFLTQVLSLFTGLLFIVLVIRNLSLADFGVWQLVGSIVGISAFPSAVIATWSLRDSARGEQVGRTSLVAGALTIALSAVVLWLIMIGVGTRIENILLVIFASLVYLSNLVIFESIKGVIQGSRPPLLGYSGIPFELAKVGMAYYLIVIARWNLQGAIVAVGLAYLAQNLVLLYSIRGELKAKFDVQRVRNWVRASWVPTLQMVVSRIWQADAIVVALLLGNSLPIGLMAGARTFTAVIAYSEVFPRILYAKLIKDRLSTDITVTFRLQALFAIPLAVGGFVLADDLLLVFGPQYVSVAPVLRLLAIIAMIEGFEHLMALVLQGIDIRDSRSEGMFFSNLKQSWLVKLPLLELLKSAIYFGILTVVLSVPAPNAETATVALLWAISYGFSVVPFAIIKAYYARKEISFSMPLKEVVLYTLSAMIMGGVLYFIRPTEAFVALSTTEALVRLLVPVLLGACIYFAIVLAFDPYIRRSVKGFIQHIQ